MTDAHVRNNDLDPGILTKRKMNVTPEKLLNSDTKGYQMFGGETCHVHVKVDHASHGSNRQK